MNRKIKILVLCMAFLSSGAFVFAQQNDNSKQGSIAAQDVYATASGRKYHKVDCPFIQNRKPHKLSKKEALEKGLAPCPKCFSEDYPTESKKK